jgi:hypothetical protein
MEVFNQGTGDGGSPIASTGAEVASLELIRTETVLSRLPVHNLAKKGKVNIQIIKTTPTGEIELKWEVSYSERYGQARQLAYKLDTIVINQRIEEAGRPLPRLLRIGSLNEICAELNLATHAGQNTKDLRRAFLQNASAFITAKFNYRANDGSERRVEAGITRYGVIFTGEKLPDGRRADAVYVAFNDPFWEVLNNAPVRPLDRAYMKELPPASQRFYEIISRKIFAALKNDYPRAKISYSEYCTFSAQLRHHERQRVQDQMAKLLRPHKASGYITAVKYEPTIDGENKPDWILYVTPGPKAMAEFAAAQGRKVRKTTTVIAGEDHKSRTASLARRTPRTPDVGSTPTHDPQLVAELTRRGITEQKAIELLANRKPGQDVVAQLEFADHMIEKSQIPIHNPPGFRIRLISSNTSIPESFETAAKRKAREEKERRDREERAAEQARQQLEWEYDDYCRTEINRYVDEHAAPFDAIKEAKWKENRARYQSFSDEMIATMSAEDAKREITKQAPIMSFEEFATLKQQGSGGPIGTVDSRAISDPAIEPPVDEQAPAVSASAEVAPTASVGAPETEPATPEPLIMQPESEAPQEEMGESAAENNLV